MTHAELVARAVRWLTWTVRCNPVYAGLASCSEIPDAIGWSSRHNYRGSVVIECKASILDFMADRQKTFRWHDPQGGYNYSARRISEAQGKQRGYVKQPVPRMGVRRFFMCEAGVILEGNMIRYPDHGLLWVRGRSVLVRIAAPTREHVDTASEIHYLRMAICNRQESLAPPSQYAERKARLLFSTRSTFVNR